MNKINILSIALLIVLSLILAFNFNVSGAQEEGDVQFYNVVPFVSPSGYYGFFDQNDGMIYIYDENIKNLKYKSQITELGAPILRIN